MYALAIGKPPAVKSRPLVRRADEMPMPAPAVSTPAAEMAEPSVSVTVDVMPASTMRHRAVVVRTVTQYAIVEYDATEGADPYAQAEAIAAAVPDDAWTMRGEPWAYIESSEPVDAPAAMADTAEQRSRAPLERKGAFSEQANDLRQQSDQAFKTWIEIADALDAGADPADYSEAFNQMIDDMKKQSDEALSLLEDIDGAAGLLRSIALTGQAIRDFVSEWHHRVSVYNANNASGEDS